MNIELQGNVPLVGQPCIVHDFQVFASATCRCHEDNPPFMILGVGTLVACNRCHKVYTIMKVEFDRQKDARAKGALGYTVQSAQGMKESNGHAAVSS